MPVKLYKPNSKNTGVLFAFEIGEGYKDKSPALYIKAVHQHHWDKNKHIGSFSEHAKRENGQLVYPEHNISVKMSEFEVGNMIDVFEHNEEWDSFHSSSSSQDQTSIHFASKPKPGSKKYKDQNGSIAEKQITVYGYSLVLTRNGAERFMIYLEPGEAIVVRQLFIKYLSVLEDFRMAENKKFFNKDAKQFTQNKTEEQSIDEIANSFFPQE